MAKDDTHSYPRKKKKYFNKFLTVFLRNFMQLTSGSAFPLSRKYRSRGLRLSGF